jgi:sporulation protein YabP
MYNEGMINNQNVKLYDRNLLEMSGINKIVSFNSDEFVLDSIMGIISIKGNSLEIIKLNTDDGNIKIKGSVDSIVYSESSKKQNKESFLTRLFK